MTALSSEFLHRSWPTDPLCLAEIRSIARDWVGALDVPAPLDHDLVLAINEAATSAVLDSDDAELGGQVTATFWTADEALWVDITATGRSRRPLMGRRTDAYNYVILQKIIDFVRIEFSPSGTRVLLCHPIAERGLGDGARSRGS
jgi:anti-sigma regulatory factor (Ser/Thr protein kinase)